MSRWLVSAFGPFEGASSNSSQIVLHDLMARSWQDQVIFAADIPVLFDGSWQALEALLEVQNIDGVLALGQAGSRTSISLERIALNWIDARTADNSGAQPRDQRIRSDGPELLWSNIDWNKISIPPSCELSYSAGVYVCNELLYKIMEWANKNSKLGGFVHIPLLTSQVEPQFDGLPKMETQLATEIVDDLLRQLINL